MSAYVNTVDSIGDAAICKSILHKTLDAITDTYCEMVGGYAFYGFTALHTAIFANAKRIEQYAFAHCSKLETIKVPLSENVGYFSFYECEKLKEADFPCVTSVSTYAFKGCIALKTLILRSGTLATLSGVNALGDTPIEKGKGYIYVPSALLESYKTAANWSTYANQFRKLEDYTVDGTVTGEVDPTRCRVRFFNGDTYLGYVMVPNGGNAVYPGDEPTRDNYAFNGFAPEPVNITADTDCYAKWEKLSVYRAILERTLSGEYYDDTTTSLGTHAMARMRNMTSVVFTNVTEIKYRAFFECSALTKIDFHKPITIASQAFYNGMSFTFDIILRGSTISTLSNKDALTSWNSIGGAYIYVPSSLIDSYKTGTNWSNFSSKFRAIEDYPDICGG